VGQGGVPLESVLFVQVTLALVALSAKGHVHVFASDHGLGVFARRAEGKAGIDFAQFANG
jgi:hypothetical protein